MIVIEEKYKVVEKMGSFKMKIEVKRLGIGEKIREIEEEDVKCGIEGKMKMRLKEG